MGSYIFFSSKSISLLIYGIYNEILSLKTDSLRLEMARDIFLSKTSVNLLITINMHIKKWLPFSVISCLGFQVWILDLGLFWWFFGAMYRLSLVFRKCCRLLLVLGWKDPLCFVFLKGYKGFERETPKLLKRKILLINLKSIESSLLTFLINSIKLSIIITFSF